MVGKEDGEGCNADGFGGVDGDKLGWRVTGFSRGLGDGEIDNDNRASARGGSDQGYKTCDGSRSDDGITAAERRDGLGEGEIDPRRDTGVPTRDTSGEGRGTKDDAGEGS